MYAWIFLICGLVFSIIGLANISDQSMNGVMILGFVLFFGSLVYLKTKSDKETKERNRIRSIARRDAAIKITGIRKSLKQ